MKHCKIVDKDTSLPAMLNAFYARFEQSTTGTPTSAPTAPDTPVPSVTTSEVRSVFLGVNPRKAMGPDSVPTRALRSYVDQLAEVFTDIFNLSLLQAKVLTCFKKTTIIPVPKKHIYKTKELIIDFRKKGGVLTRIYINGTEVERMKSIKFLGVTITNDLSWTAHINTLVKNAQQCLFFLRRFRKFGMFIRSLTNFYRCTIESKLSGCIMAWYGNCSAQDRKKLQKVLCTAQTIMEAKLPSMDSIYSARCCGKAANIIKDPSHA
eukprot:g32236.t1